MVTVREIICIQCPQACRVQVHIDDKGAMEEVSGYQCKEGKAYAAQEYESPRRVLTTTVKTEGSARQLLPVRSQRAIPKDMLGQCVQVLSKKRVKAPLKMGSIIVADILGTGVDIVCTDDLLY